MPLISHFWSMFARVWNIKYILIALVVISVFTLIYFQTYGRNALGPYTSPIIWFAAGMIFALASFFHRHLRNADRPIPGTYAVVCRVIGWLAFLLSCALSYSHLEKLFRKYPVKLDGSDVIPTIQTFVQRFLEREEVYTSIQYPGYESIPTYLSLTWLPYIPAEIFSWDYRWTAFTAIVLISTILLIKAWKNTVNKVSWLLLALTISLVIHGLSTTDEGNMRFAVEFLPAAYYLILFMTLNSRQPAWVILGISLCILSRYSLVLWLPAYGFILWKEHGIEYFLKIVVGVAIVLLCLYILPFIGTDWEILTRGFKFYAENAASKWTPFSWQPDGSKPFHLKQGYGFALQFFSGYTEDIQGGIDLMKRIQLISVSVISVATVGLYIKFRTRLRGHIKIYLATSLMIYLLLFYSFLYAPYGYLYFIPLCAAPGVMYAWARSRRNYKQPKPV